MGLAYKLVFCFLAFIYTVLKPHFFLLFQSTSIFSILLTKNFQQKINKLFPNGHWISCINFIWRHVFKVRLNHQSFASFLFFLKSYFLFYLLFPFSLCWWSAVEFFWFNIYVCLNADIELLSCRLRISLAYIS